jgi:hypothetical protein
MRVALESQVRHWVLADPEQVLQLAWQEVPPPLASHLLVDAFIVKPLLHTQELLETAALL